MAFDDVAKRMTGRRGLTRGERLEQLWTGEVPELPPLPAPVSPAGRTKALIAAYVVLLAGLALAAGAGLVLALWFGQIDRWEGRGLYAVIAIGIGLVIQATTMFGSVEETDALPAAKLRP